MPEEVAEQVTEQLMRKQQHEPIRPSGADLGPFDWIDARGNNGVSN